MVESNEDGVNETALLSMVRESLLAKKILPRNMKKVREEVRVIFQIEGTLGARL
jgi:hypothetical protein